MLRGLRPLARFEARGARLVTWVIAVTIIGWLYLFGSGSMTGPEVKNPS